MSPLFPQQAVPEVKLGFDFDGVIADTAEAFIRIACEQYAYCGIRLEQITSFMVEQCLDMDVHTVESIFHAIGTDPLGTGLRPMPGAIEALTAFSEEAPVTIITARPEHQPLDAWLQRMLPSHVYARTEVVAMGDHDNKVPHVQKLGLTHFIDDRAETCIQLHAAGIHSIVFTQPWNHNQHSLPTVKNWQEIQQVFL